MNEFECKGHWIIPGFEHEIGGTLKFHPKNGAYLETWNDDFSYEAEQMKDDIIVGQPILINGLTNDGDFVTLYCGLRGYTGSLPSSTHYRVEVIFFGCHFKKDDDISFDSITIHYSNIERWMNVRNYTLNYTPTGSGGPRSIEVKHTLPEPLTVPLDGLDIIIRYEFVNPTPTSDRFVGTTIKQAAYIEIKPKQPTSYKEYQSKFIYPLRNFLSLAMDRVVLPLMVNGKTGTFSEEYENGRPLSKEINIFYLPKGSDVLIQEQQSQDMLFHYGDVADDFQRYLQNWFAIAVPEKLLSVFDLYFGIAYIPSMYVHLQFLTLAQALETYHRNKDTGEYMSKNTYKPIKKELEIKIDELTDGIFSKEDKENQGVEAFDKEKEFNQRLKTTIQYGYQYMQKTRFTHLLTIVLADYKLTIDRLINNHEQFVKDMVNTRDYLTHYSDDSKKKAIIEPIEQYKFVQQMKLLIQLCFFNELQLPAELVNNLMLNNRNFQNFLPQQAQNKKVWGEE